MGKRLRPVTLIKNRHWRRFFLVNLAKFWEHLSFKEQLRCLILATKIYSNIEGYNGIVPWVNILRRRRASKCESFFYSAWYIFSIFLVFIHMWDKLILFRLEKAICQRLSLQKFIDSKIFLPQINSLFVNGQVKSRKKHFNW